MIGSSRALRVWAYPQGADLRKGFDGLSALVSHQLGKDALSGECFLFVNRQRTRAKVLLWDGTGLCLYHKRLEAGRFAPLWRPGGGAGAVQLTMSELGLYLEGCELVGRRSLSPPAFALAGRGAPT